VKLPHDVAADVGEFDLIARVTARMSGGPACLLGPGDDAALVAAPDGRVLASTDVLVEGRHFRRDWCSGTDVGHRAAAANLADIVAMGGIPTALLVAVCVPADLETAWAERFAEGLSAEAALAGAGVVGGDTTSSDTLTIAVTALGDLGGGRAVLRSGARPGDVVALAGRIGWAAAGYALLAHGLAEPARPVEPAGPVEAYRRPIVPYPAGPVACDEGATAMIDVSDGLLADLGHIARASGVAVDLRRDAFEVPEPIQDAARQLRAAGVEADPYRWILTGGDDHPLAATFPAETGPPAGWLPIGVVRPGSGVTVDGEPYPGQPGWEHLR
jgi:thiamine-monophosphate kinase